VVRSEKNLYKKVSFKHVESERVTVRPIHGESGETRVHGFGVVCDPILPTKNDKIGSVG